MAEQAYCIDNDPKPGSDAALAQGCMCPVLDNAHGKGRGGDGDRWGFYINEGCPLHGRPHPQEASHDE
jgi:hypothetical protein